MSRRPTITEDQREDFTRRWEAGELGAEIAAAFGCSTTTVSQTAARFGLAPRNEHTRALTGGAWVPDRYGIARWVPGAGT